MDQRVTDIVAGFRLASEMVDAGGFDVHHIGWVVSDAYYSLRSANFGGNPSAPRAIDCARALILALPDFHPVHQQGVLVAVNDVLARTKDQDASLALSIVYPTLSI